MGVIQGNLGGSLDDEEPGRGRGVRARGEHHVVGRYGGSPCRALLVPAYARHAFGGLECSGDLKIPDDGYAPRRSDEELVIGGA